MSSLFVGLWGDESYPHALWLGPSHLCFDGQETFLAAKRDIQVQHFADACAEAVFRFNKCAAHSQVTEVPLEGSITVIDLNQPGT